MGYKNLNLILVSVFGFHFLFSVLVPHPCFLSLDHMLAFCPWIISLLSVLGSYPCLLSLNLILATGICLRSNPCSLSFNPILLSLAPFLDFCPWIPSLHYVLGSHLGFLSLDPNPCSVSGSHPCLLDYIE